MKGPLLLVLAAAVSVLPAQDKPAAGTAAQLPQLRAAFAAAQMAEPAAIIAVVQGSEPVILTAGSDASGKDLTPLTLVPLLTQAKVLAADAIYVHLKDKIDKGSGTKLGERELSVRELLDGVTLLPDFYVLDGGDDPVDAALLRNCGAMAAGAKMELGGSRLGAPEFELLEPLAFGGRDKDWPSMLRSTLAPRVTGLDPVSAHALEQKARGCTILAVEALANLAKARPVVLRTMLSLQNLGTWLQWRVQQEVPLWTSARMGRMGPSLTQPKEQCWMAASTALGVTMSLSQYPSRQAALLWILPEKTQLIRPLRLAFESDLYATEQAAAQGPSNPKKFQGALAGARLDTLPASSVLTGTRWCSTPADGKQAVRLAFGVAPKEPLVLTVDGDPLPFDSMTRMGDGLCLIATRRAGVGLRLWLRPEPDADKPTKITCVLVTARTSGTDPSVPRGGAAVPQYFELLPEKN